MGWRGGGGGTYRAPIGDVPGRAALLEPAGLAGGGAGKMAAVGGGGELEAAVAVQQAGHVTALQPVAAFGGALATNSTRSGARNAGYGGITSASEKVAAAEASG